MAENTKRAECLCAEIDPSDCPCLVCEAYAYLEAVTKEEADGDE